MPRPKSGEGVGIPHQMSLENHGLRTVVQKKNLFQFGKEAVSFISKLSVALLIID